MGAGRVDSKEAPDGTSSPKEAFTIVKTFADLRPHLRKLIRRVHPDAVHSQEDHVRAQNHESLLALDVMMNALKERCELVTKPKAEPGMLQPVHESTVLQFYWVETTKNAEEEVEILRKTSYNAKMPMELDAQTRLVINRAIASPTLHSQWLNVAATHVKALLDGVSVPCNLRLKDAAAAKKKKRLFNEAPQPMGAEALLRENLTQWSPLQQGKVKAFPGPQPLSNKYSVFTAKQRSATVGALFTRGNVRCDPALTPIEAAKGRERVARFLTDNFDRSYMYLDVWRSITITVGRVFMYVPVTRTLYVPFEFEQQAMADFLDDNLPGIIEEANRDAQAKADGLPRRRRQRTGQEDAAEV